MKKLLVQCFNCDVCYADEDNIHYIDITDCCVECVHGSELNAEERERNAMNNETAINEYQQHLADKATYYFEMGSDADAIGNDHYARRCAQAMDAIEHILNQPSLEDSTMNNNEMIAALESHIADTAEVKLEDVSQHQVVSIMSTDLIGKGLMPAQAMVVAGAWFTSWADRDDMEMFFEMLNDGINSAVLSSGSLMDKESLNRSSGLVSLDEAVAALWAAEYLVGEEIGPRFHQILNERKEAYLMPLASEGVTRRFGYVKTKHSPLFVEAIHAQEATESTIDAEMLELAKAVVAARPGVDDAEAYVIKGCDTMNPELNYVSEFKGDLRGRTYQASCFGYNGQASDRSRSLMNLADVPMDYNPEDALALVKAEMADMVIGPVTRGLVREAVANPVEFIVTELDAADNDDGSVRVKKPYSFVKAAKIATALVAGETPYIGMAFGLDAKCSGPQLGALMANSERVSGACGFSPKSSGVKDVYQQAIERLAKDGMAAGITRNDIKKPFMAVFYGQAAPAFTNPESMNATVWAAVHGSRTVGSEEQAKKFHANIVNSFGPELKALRAAVSSYKGKVDGKISHFMPDGFKVAMDYRVNINIDGLILGGKDIPKLDAMVEIGAYEFIMQKAAFRLKDADSNSFVRTGFVNMIQATDALLARLIVVHLNRMGAQHIVAVHDCFRVNVHDMAILNEAIKAAYSDMFASATLDESKTADLPKGGDILAMYFEGANKALVEGAEGKQVSQFTSGGRRMTRKVNGRTIADLIADLGGENGTYFFEK